MEATYTSESHGIEVSVSQALLSYDFKAAAFLDSPFCGHGPRRHVFSSDKLKSRTLLLPPVRPRPPPSAPRRPQTDACWGTRPTPAGTASARLPRLATTVVAVVGVAPCRPQRIRTVTTHTPAPRLGALPSPVLDPCPQPLQGGWLVCRSWSSQARTPQQTLLTSMSLVASTTHPGNPGRRGSLSLSVSLLPAVPSLCCWQLPVATVY